MVVGDAKAEDEQDRSGGNQQRCELKGGSEDEQRDRDEARNEQEHVGLRRSRIAVEAG